MSENILAEVAEWKNTNVEPKLKSIAEASDFVKVWKKASSSNSYSNI